MDLYSLFYCASRRVRKTSYTWSGGWVEDADGDQLFVYDRWNVVLVLNANAGSDTLRKYTWGLDLSGWMGAPGAAGIHGAGGIGGLLAAEETATAGAPKYWFFCDGNGNVTQIIDPNDFWPEPAAHYEYDPYGQLIRALDVDGSGYVNTNLFRFSTKWFDTETGLSYYGYRYYDPRLGRWTSEDPLEEIGGLNLYCALFNDTLNKYDAVGRSPADMPISCEGCVDSCMQHGFDARSCKDMCKDACKPPQPPPRQFWRIPILDNPRHCKIATTCCRCVGYGAAALATGGMSCTIIAPASACAGLVTMPLGAATYTIGTATGGVIVCTGHGIQRMQERGITPSVVLNAIQNGVCQLGSRAGTLVYTFEKVRVVVNSCSGAVITAIKTGS